MKDTLKGTLLWIYSSIMFLIAIWHIYLIWPVNDGGFILACMITWGIIIAEPPLLIFINYYTE